MTGYPKHPSGTDQRLCSHAYMTDQDPEDKDLFRSYVLVPEHESTAVIKVTVDLETNGMRISDGTREIFMDFRQLEHFMTCAADAGVREAAIRLPIPDLGDLLEAIFTAPPEHREEKEEKLH